MIKFTPGKLYKLNLNPKIEWNGAEWNGALQFSVYNKQKSILVCSKQEQEQLVFLFVKSLTDTYKTISGTTIKTYIFLLKDELIFIAKDWCINNLIEVSSSK